MQQPPTNERKTDDVITVPKSALPYTTIYTMTEVH